MRGYKTIDQFNLQECEVFLTSNADSPYANLVIQRHAELLEEQQNAIQMKQQREQQEMYVQVVKEERRKKRNSVLLIILLILTVGAAILIILTYTNDDIPPIPNEDIPIELHDSEQPVIPDEGNAIMPDLHSLSVRHAISQLENAGLHGGKLIFVDDPNQVVIEQRYKGRTVATGRKLEKEAMVDLVVGRGNGSDLTIVPYLVGMAPLKARRSLLSSSLNVGVEHFDGITDMSCAIVYRQSPSYTGSPSESYGARVELWYCDKSLVSMEELERVE